MGGGGQMQRGTRIGNTWTICQCVTVNSVIIADFTQYTSLEHILHGDNDILHISTVILSGLWSLYGNIKLDFDSILQNSLM